MGFVTLIHRYTIPSWIVGDVGYEICRRDVLESAPFTGFVFLMLLRPLPLGAV
jgi:hypothetical protein